MDLVCAGTLVYFVVIWLVVIESLATNTTRCSTGQFGAFEPCSAQPQVHIWMWALDATVMIALFCSYFALFDGLGNGQTLGKIAAGIAVRDETDGTRIGLGRSTVRTLARLLLYFSAIIPGFIGDLWALWDKQAQTLADKAARAVVIRTR